MIKVFITVVSIFGLVSGLDYKEAANIIKTDVTKYKTDDISSLCNRHHCCNITSSEECNLSNFKKDITSLIYPGGQTRCIFSTSTDFSFQIIPGDSDKVLFYFQGGGACWNEETTMGDTLCSTDATPLPHWGVFDRNQESNAFRSYTVVNVLYCSGDIHGGNVVQDYVDSNGEPVQQKGLANAQSALDWVANQQHNGNLSAELTSLVVMGCSAGSVGAQLWSAQVTKTLKWKQAAVIPDSYAGVFPPGSQGPLVYNYGFCSSGFLNKALYAKCMNKELTLQDINMQNIRDSPEVPISFIQSKTDIVQMSFYVAIGATTPDTSAFITPKLFYNDVNAIFEEYNAQSNFLTYLVDGDMHCYTCDPLWYTADAMGPVDGGKSNAGPMLADWAGMFPLADGEQQSTVCEGEAVSSSAVSAVNDEVYCDANLVPKSFTEEYN